MLFLDLSLTYPPQEHHFNCKHGLECRAGGPDCWQLGSGSDQSGLRPLFPFPETWLWTQSSSFPNSVQNRPLSLQLCSISHCENNHPGNPFQSVHASIIPMLPIVWKLTPSVVRSLDRSTWRSLIFQSTLQRRNIKLQIILYIYIGTHLLFQNSSCLFFFFYFIPTRGYRCQLASL